MRVHHLAPLALLSFALVACPESKKPAPSPAPTPSAKATTSGSTAPSASAAASAAPAQLDKPAEPLNVLLLTVDSLRADRMPWAGYERKVVPNIAALAEKGVVYENAYSVSSYTAQSVATFLTGRYASTLYRSGVFFTQYGMANDFISEVLQEKGVRTQAWHAHMYFGMNKKKNLSQGFDDWEIVKGITFNAQTDEHVTSEKMTKLGQELLKKNSDGKQFFAWAHYMDPHDQYVRHASCPKDWGKKNPDRYDCEVLHTDKWIGTLLDWAKTQPWWNKTAVVISADHGEAFGEHDRWKHAFDVYEVLNRVPFIVYAPGVKPRKIAERRTHIDLAPTIMGLMGKKPLKGFQGESLVPELYGAEPKQRPYIYLELSADSHNPQKSAVIQGDYKVMSWNRGWKKFLFNLKKDPGELNNLAEKEPAKMKEMWALWEKAYKAVPRIKPYGGNKLKGGGIANGPRGPEKDAKEQ